MHYIGYITIKDFDYVNIRSGNFQYFIIGEVEGCIEETGGNKYLTLESKDKN